MGGATQRLVVGMFSVAPATGVVTAGQSQTITVDCIAEKPGRHDEVHVHVHLHVGGIFRPYCGCMYMYFLYM